VSRKGHHTTEHGTNSNKLLLFLESTGTASSMLAASFLALQIGEIFTLYLFWLYGSVALTFSSRMRKNSIMTALMLFYTVLNLVGLWSFK